MVRAKLPLLERVVLIIPYKDAELAKKIREVFSEINLDRLGIKNKAEQELNTRILTPEELVDRSLDVLTGF